MLYHSPTGQKLDSRWPVEPAVNITSTQAKKIECLVKSRAFPGYLGWSKFFSLALMDKEDDWYHVVLHKGSSDEETFLRKLLNVLTQEQIKQLSNGKTPSELIEMILLPARHQLYISDQNTIKALIKDLNSSNLFLRRKAACKLGNFGAAAKEAVPYLIKALKDKDLELQVKAANALGKMGAVSAKATPCLIQMLNSPLLGVRIAATETLQNIGLSAGHDLIESLQSPNPHVRFRCAQALGKCGVGIKKTVPSLIAVLNDSNGSVREGAVFSLGELGTVAKNAIPALIKIAENDTYSMARWRAICALRNIGTDVEIIKPVLVNALKDKDCSVRAAAAETLHVVGVSVKNHLTGALQDKSNLVRVGAAYSLIKIDPKGKTKVNYLIKIAKDVCLTDGGMITAGLSAIDAIGDLGPMAEEAVPSLIEFLCEEDIISVHALLALQKIGPPAVQGLIKATKDDRIEIQKVAREALKKIRQKTPVVPAENTVCDEKPGKSD